MKKITYALGLLGILTFAGNVRAQEACIPGDIIVMMKPGASADALVHDLRTVNGEPTQLRVVREVSAPMRAWLLHYENADLPQQVVRRAVDMHPAVQFAQDNHIVTDRAIPNDPGYGAQWQHQNIDSEAAWDITTGGVTATGDTIVVCIVEQADLPHPDLIGNAWHNYHEIPGNGNDDDGNGYVDDFLGWNPAGNNDVAYGGSHGTEVAGMIGAKGNNGSQVAGANWNVKLMVVTRAGVAEDAVVSSYTYPLVMRRAYNASNGALGAFVVATNASWGIDNADHTQYPIWCAMYDTLGTAGILNCGATANNSVDIDVNDDMPTGCESDFMISVTATDVDDQRTFSGWGLTTIDVGAPGAAVFTTQIGGGTGLASGTSFASPLTAGVIGLLYSAPCANLMDLVHSDPMAGALYVRQALFNGVEQVGNLPGNTVTGGRINSNNSLLWIMNACGACPIPYNLGASMVVIGAADLHWSSPSASVFNVRYRVVGSPAWNTTTGINATELAITGIAACTPYEFQVQAACDIDTSGYSSSLMFTSEGCCTVPLTITVMATDSAHATVAWSNVLAANTYDLQYRVQGTGNWTSVVALTGGSTELSGLAGCTTYEVQMRTSCDGSTTTDWGASTVFNTPGCGQCAEGTFCPSVSANASTEWIQRVQLNTIDNESGTNGGYAAFTEQGTSLVIGQAYDITLTQGYANFNFTEYFTVWLDLNGNGLFESPGELIFDPGSASGTPVLGTLVVPVGTTPVSTRMRVVMKFQDPAADGCETNYGYGETEDYCVTLEPFQGIEELVDHAALCFPVPADHEVFITIPALITSSTVEILATDVTGKIVARGPMSGGKAELHTSSFPSGLYFFRVLRDGTGIARGRFEVAH